MAFTPSLGPSDEARAVLHTLRMIRRCVAVTVQVRFSTALYMAAPSAHYNAFQTCSLTGAAFLNMT
jgi:hypothetical protein